MLDFKNWAGGWLLAFLLTVSACGPGPARSDGGAVSAGTPEAGAAGKEILESGGNAVDAAVAVAFTLAVTEPAGSGLGGQTTMLIHPSGGKPVVLNGSSFSPGTLPADAAGDLQGRRYSTVPATVRTLGYAWRRHGSGRVDWARLLEPAIRAAERGFRWGGFRYRALVNYGDELLKDPTAARIFLKSDGSLPESGSLQRQPALAATLKRLAENGPDDFYSGEIAREIARDMEQNGGWITLEDLNNVPDPAELKPLKSVYRGWDVYTTPPPTGGWVVLQVLNVLERAPRQVLAREGPERLVWLAEALRIGHRSRKNRPVTHLVEYQDEVAEKIDKMLAGELSRSFEAPDGSGETTHFSVVDGEGAAVAVTQSINSYFGCKVAHPTLGFFYNDYLKEFEMRKPRHPYALGTRKMPYSSMAPSVLAKDDRVALVLGSPGSARIISAVVQTISHWVDVGRGVEAAVAARRIHVVPEEDLYVENIEVEDLTRTDLSRRGFKIRKTRTGFAIGQLDAYFGGVHALAMEGGAWKGAADPRRDGVSVYAAAPDSVK